MLWAILHNEAHALVFLPSCGVYLSFGRSALLYNFLKINPVYIFIASPRLACCKAPDRDIRSMSAVSIISRKATVLVT